jgi:hypothetical protein
MLSWVSVVICVLDDNQFKCELSLGYFMFGI